MKFRLLSDLHLEFGPYLIVPHEDDAETTLILAGDIHVGTKAADFIEQAADQFQHVVYLLGNHEFYGYDVSHIREEWARIANEIDNLHFLDDGVTTIGNVRILGGTLWTDFDNASFTAMRVAAQRMNDYVKIRDRGVGFRPQDALGLHRVTLAFLKEELARPWPGKTIVATHHLPHPLCIDTDYRGEGIINAAYHSNLDDLIVSNDIDIWCHGHTHRNVDLFVPGTKTRILCNPRGYHGYEINPGFDGAFSFELDTK